MSFDWDDRKGFRVMEFNTKKEQNWHVESFHRRIEEDLFDTKAISNLKQKVKDWIIDKTQLKKEILKLLNNYVLNFNNYWYSSYKPRYELF
jgi:predicted nuclease of restriction endonuclease-like (RecB) superfamily